MSRFTITPTPLAGLLCLQRQPLADERGFLARLFCAQELAAAGWPGPVALLIPPGLAHRFQALQDGAELLYVHSAPYTPACEGALNVHDPRLCIAWPLPVHGLSPRDAAHPLLGIGFQGIVL